MIEPLRLLLQDVLTDSGLRYELTSRPDACDVVIVLVNWGEEVRVLVDARARAGDVPLLAILPFGDDGLVERVLLGGAKGWFALDTPLVLLWESLVKLAGPGASPEAEPALKPE
ncbi:MAG: hypothetical protein IT371_14090 [Deltaproteobacteria bacterium]|nr:hypothetical protein [Deltaproteobacteria bacterium]